jgi:acyl-CoA synthetase (AMP-forming)/AMP-acid ligase II
VINRDGETVAPTEVEEAVRTHGAVKDAMAFAVPHATLQETVGVVLVLRSNVLRPDVPALHRHLEHRLHPAKFPQLIVYMDGYAANITVVAKDWPDSQTLRHPWAD